MKAHVAQFVTARGTRETRIYLQALRIRTGEIVPGVTVFPHVCGTCVGGDHTHVDLHQIPESIGREVEVPDHVLEAVMRYAEAILPLNDLTAEMAKLIRA